MPIPNLDAADADTLAPIALAAIQRLGQLGRAGALALARLVADGDADFDEAASWITDIASGALKD